MTVDPEQVAQYLPLTGADMPTIKGRVINVTHYIPYNCILLNDSHSESVPNGKLVNGSQSPDSLDASAAPFSRLPTRRRQATTVFEEKQWKFTQRRGHSAMYSGIQSLQHEWETIHIGWTGAIHEELSGDVVFTKSLTSEDKVTLTKALREKGHIIPIFLDDDQSAGHYEGYCKSGTVSRL
ncbi:hypothetical protein BC937DRAFT_86335 [Endogone sp. FLAS-F59071]|nr:hypothetical protein BC937DRAFT_86335 [Endogone sp. FLAS-F59071]|eukprot:RUS20114.1 hypothetical protein BC937DRAFT_86335 [Endogone sp. FLAS-F59071]